MKKRNLYHELIEGMDALEAERKANARIKKVRLEIPATPSKVVASAVRKRNQVQ